MKVFTTKSIAFSAIFVLASSLLSTANATEVAKVSVNGMVCAFCAQGIEKTISKMPQTKAVYVNLDQKLVAVEPKDGQKLDMAKVKAGIVDAGYDVVRVEMASNTSVAAIKAQMSGKK